MYALTRVLALDSLTRVLALVSLTQVLAARSLFPSRFFLRPRGLALEASLAEGDTPEAKRRRRQ